VRRVAAALLVGVSLTVATPAAVAQSGGDGGAGASGTVWLCRPRLADNPCDLDRTTTVLKADGTDGTQKVKPAKKPPIDCFYVYPTVSGQPTTNANLDIDPELIAVAQFQASRFTDVCRVFAPVYPQLTVQSIATGAIADAQARAVAYDGVLSAWKDYLANFNKGRGVVLIGHSQGAGILTVLARNEIDKDPALRKRVVSALLLGGNVTVAAGSDRGGSFENIPACGSRDQVGCVVAYSTFDAPPPEGALFGRVRPGVNAAADLEVLCVNPAAPGDDRAAPLHPYFRTEPFPGVFSIGRSQFEGVSTPWVTLPKLYTGQCSSAEGANWLQVDHAVTAGDARPQVTPVLGPTWGLHLVDVNIALGDLVDLVRTQSVAYRR